MAVPKMGRFFVALVLAVALQVATAVGSDRGDDGHWPWRIGGGG